ncbi:MAG: hypothetical protein MUC39_04335 [Candidatus Omnitrophica bacterium]|jgi:type II secretory pathway pseudopilin PulG|nr:hypothetical protein [Candidatus Omnitrophota bacterium]
MRRHAITLLELLIAIILLSTVVMAVSSISLFSQHHTVSASRRADLQNDVSLVITHMGKYVAQGVGDQSGNVALVEHKTGGNADGFSVRVDLQTDLNKGHGNLQTTPTPGNLDDDLWLHYYLDPNDNNFKFACTQIGPDSPACLAGEILSKKIIAGTKCCDQVMPLNPDTGFYINFTDNATVVEVGLVARYDKTIDISTDNPQVELKNRLYTRSSSNR